GGGGNRRQNVPLRHQTFDSNGPDVRIRGNAWQVHEKYLALARDASSSGDRVQAENYLQHAEHYFRIINQIQESENRQRGNVGAAGLGPQPSLGGSAEDEDGGEMGDESETAADERTPMSA
ncbi:DUF4167 domain-containing protein, partial [Azospirillum brasilense]